MTNAGQRKPPSPPPPTWPLGLQISHAAASRILQPHVLPRDAIARRWTAMMVRGAHVPLRAVQTFRVYFDIYDVYMGIQYIVHDAYMSADARGVSMICLAARESRNWNYNNNNNCWCVHVRAYVCVWILFKEYAWQHFEGADRKAIMKSRVELCWECVFVCARSFNTFGHCDDGWKRGGESVTSHMCVCLYRRGSCVIDRSCAYIWFV